MSVAFMLAIMPTVSGIYKRDSAQRYRLGVPGYTGSSIQVAIIRTGDSLFLKASRLCVLQRLSRRELAVAQLYGQGVSHKEVARHLEIAPATVRNFLQRIYTKLEITDKAELAALVARNKA